MLLATAKKDSAPARRGQESPRRPVQRSSDSGTRPTFAPAVVRIQRACACGGGCPACTTEPPYLDVQPQLEVSQPGDRYEREADLMADRVLGRVSSRPITHTGSLASRRPPVPRTTDATPVSSSPDLVLTLTGGRPLPESTQHEMESFFGADFSQVRVHTDTTSSDMNRRLHARAFTHKSHVYFAAGTYQPYTRSGKGLIAHELTHVVQQGSATPHWPKPASESNQQSARAPPTKPGSSASLPFSTISALPRLSRRHTPSIQRDIVDTAEELWNATGGRVVEPVRSGLEDLGERAGGLLETGREFTEGVVNEHAPGLLSFLRSDLITAITDRILGSLSSAFSSVISGIGTHGIVGFLQEVIGGLLGTVSSAAGNLSGAVNCSAVAEAAQRIVEFAQSLSSEALGTFREITSRLGEFFTDVWSETGAPAIDFIRRYATDAWNWIQETADRLWDLTDPIRRGFLTAWEWVRDLFNLAWNGVSTVADWLSEKASAAWDRVMEFIRPVLGPLRVLGGILLMLSPIGPIIALWQGIPRLWEGLRWIARSLLNPEMLRRARELLVEEILPAILEGIATAQSLISAGYQWLVGLIDSAVSAVRSVLDSLGIIRLFTQARDAVQGLWSDITEIAATVRSALGELMNAAGQLLGLLWAKVRPVLIFLIGLSFMISNPNLWPVFIVGLAVNLAWHLIPDCIKVAFIDVLLDLAITFVSSYPGPPLLEPLWEIAQLGLLSFFRQLRSYTPDEKMGYIERVLGYTISPNYWAGVFLGLLRGFLWDGLVGLLRMVYDLVVGIPRAIITLFRFFINLALDLEGIADLIRRANELKDRLLEFIQSPDALDQIVSLIQRAPSIMMEMIQRALEEGRDWAQNAGQSTAQSIFRFIMGRSDFEMGMVVGRVTGMILFEVALALLTAGVGSAVKWGGKALAWIGRGVRMVVNGIVRGSGLITRGLQTIGRILRVGWELARRVGRQLGQLLSRLQTYIDDVLRWFMRAFERAFRGMPALRRFAEQQALWLAFRASVFTAFLPYRLTGVIYGQALRTFENVRRAYSRVARRWVQPVKPEGGYWLLQAVKGSIPVPREVGRIRMDRPNRWRRGRRAVLEAIEPLRDDEDLTTERIQRVLNPIKEDYAYDELEAVWDPDEYDWNIMGEMSPAEEIADLDKTVDLHLGTRSDPIPISWYKNPRWYPTVRLRFPDPTGWQNYRVESATELPYTPAGRGRIRIGIERRFLVRRGWRMRRTRVGERRSGVVQERYRDVLSQFGYDMNAHREDADHVLDLGMGGVDRYRNIFPLDSSINRIGFEGGFYRTRIIYKLNNEENDIKTLSQLTGKWFIVKGFRMDYPLGEELDGFD
jgi:hypothetical protein